MNRERLEQMVTMLRDLPEKKGALDFVLDDWNCGTSACAVGHACLDPIFKDQGLAVDWGGDPTYHGEMGWAAVIAFFDIHESTAYHLFGDWAYTTGSDTTPDMVADRIAELLSEA